MFLVHILYCAKFLCGLLEMETKLIYFLLKYTKDNYIIFKKIEILNTVKSAKTEP